MAGEGTGKIIKQLQNMKKKIVMVTDDPKWAFGISANDMVRFMPEFDFKIISYFDHPDNIEHYKDADLVYLFGHYMVDWLPLNMDLSRVCTGIRAVFGYQDDPQEIKPPSDCRNAQHILRFPFVHTVSAELQKLFNDFHPNSYYACHGVDTEFFSQKPYYRKDKLVIGWAGNRDNKIKGFDLLEQAVSGRNDIVLKTAEYGPNQLNREQLRHFYHSLDVFVLPSISEGCSAAMLEAISCGLPIIATNVGGWQEISKKTKGGITIERTAQSINDAINKIKDANLEKMGKANRAEMVKNWDWKIKAKDFVKFFNKAMAYKPTKTADTFTNKWIRMPSGYGYKTPEQTEFFQNWMCKKLGVRNLSELNSFYKSKRDILEVGFGSGFNIKYISNHCGANITGVDLSPVACQKAKKEFRDYPKVKIVNADVMDLPFEKDSFDLIIADGIMHHLPDTHQGVLELFKRLRSGGHLYMYFYKKMGALRELSNDILREKISKMSVDKAISECEKITDLGKQLSQIKTKIKLDKIDILGLPAGEYTPHEIFYYGVMKCFWNDIFDYSTNNLNNFDWFHPEIARRYDQKTIEEWLNKLPCSYKINDSNLNGISVLVTKK